MGLRDWLGFGKRKQESTALAKRDTVGGMTLPPGAQILPTPTPLAIPQIKPTGGSHTVTDVVSGYWFCYDRETEILTKAGWKHFPDLTDDDEVATLEMMRGAFEWQKPIARTSYNYDGPMMSFRSRLIDQLVTPEHRILVNQLPRKAAEILGVRGTRPQHRHLIPAAILAQTINHHVSIPISADRWDAPDLPGITFGGEPGEKPITMTGRQYCQFLGLYLSEGSLQKKQGHGLSQVKIWQAQNSLKLPAMWGILEDIFGDRVHYYDHHGTREDPGCFIICSKPLAEHVANFGKDCYSKYIPEPVRNASRADLQAFWDTYCLGDGQRRERKKSARKYRLPHKDRISTSSSRMADCLQEIAVKMGYSASIGARDQSHCIGRKVTLTGSPIKTVQGAYCVGLRSMPAASDIEAGSEPYKGKVFCVTVPNGIVYVRRSGKPCWSGNSALQPIKPMAPAGQRVRQYEIQPGANIIWTPKTEVEGSGPGFQVLRYFADSWDLLRLVIETVKDRMSVAEWEMRLVRKKGEKQSDFERRSDDDKRLEQLTQFFKYPDGEHCWSDWVRPLLEDMLVIDAGSIYMERDNKGRIACLRVIDGGTVGRMLTDQGTTPPPPQVAYQQVLYGLPALDLTTDDLVYAMRNPRANRRYGFPPTEQCMITIATGLNVQKFKLDYFTAGNMPEALCFLPQDLPLDKVKEVQEWFDSILAGDLSKRRRLTFLPGYGTGKDARPNIMFSKEVLLKDPLDEWLWQIVCYAYGVPSQALMRMMNRATAQTNAETAQEEGLGPKLSWLASTINLIVQKRMGFDDIEFAWSQPKEVDIEKQANVDKTYVGCAVKTINEVRDGLGLDPLPFAEADEPGVMTQNGFVPLTGGLVNQPGAVGSAQGKAGQTLVGNMQDYSDQQEQKQQEQKQQSHAQALELQAKAKPPIVAPGGAQPAGPAAAAPPQGKQAKKCAAHPEYQDGCFRCALARLETVEELYEFAKTGVRKFRVEE
jgi:hypothetical protein